MAVVKHRLAVVAIVGLAAMLAFLFAGQQAWAGNAYTLSSDGYAPQGVEYDGDGDETPTYVFEDGAIRVENVTAGDVSYDPASKTLTLDGVSADAILLENEFDMTIELAGANVFSSRFVAQRTSDCHEELIDGNWTTISFEPGLLTIIGDGSADSDGDLAISYSGGLTIEGGTVNGNIQGDMEPTSNHWNFTMTGGTVNGRVDAGWHGARIAGGTITAPAPALSAIGVKMSGGRIIGGVRCAESPMVLSGGSITQTSSQIAVDCCDQNFTMSGGSIVKAGSKHAVRCKAFSMSGGSIKQTGGNVGITCTSFKQSKGTITVSGADRGVYANGGNITITGGTLKATSTNGPAIEATGKIAITGGALTATAKYPKKHAAFKAKSMTNKSACLKSVKGTALPAGASFKVGGNEYKRTWKGSVSLMKYGSSSKYPVFNTVSYGGAKYNVNGIGAKAFQTKQGAAVKYIRFTKAVNTIGANAFYGTKNLTKLRFNCWQINKHYRLGQLQSITWSSKASIAKTAFAKCGKSNGKKLTVDFNEGVRYSQSAKYKRLFISKGMPKGFRLLTY